MLAGVLASILTGKLTVTGALAGGVLGLLLYLGSGWTGIALMAVFFILGTVATSYKRSKKELLGIAETNQGRRHAGQVLANGGAGAALSLLAWMYPQQASLLQVMIAAAFSSATADTLSSELGSVYGKRFYNILSFRKDKRGLDGVVSMEGFAAGLAGSITIATVHAIGFGWSMDFLWIIIAGTIGNLTDSILGATLERRNFLSNDAVNFLNTFVASVIVYLLHK